MPVANTSPSTCQARAAAQIRVSTRVVSGAGTVSPEAGAVAVDAAVVMG
jgi:hypothetical protein